MHTLERFADELLGVLAARPLVHAPCLVQRGPDRHPGVQRRVGVLEDHLHPAPELAQLTARGGAHVEAIELDPPGVGFDQPHQAARERGLAAARPSRQA